MSAVVTSAGTGTTTAEDSLKQKSRDAGVVRGGHLVAKALKSEGGDTILPLCGGHTIGIVIGRRCRDVSVKDAGASIFGYAIVNDVATADLPNENPHFPQWCRATGSDTFCCIGPAIASGVGRQSGRVVMTLDGSTNATATVSITIDDTGARGSALAARRKTSRLLPPRALLERHVSDRPAARIEEKTCRM